MTRPSFINISACFAVVVLGIPSECSVTAADVVVLEGSVSRTNLTPAGTPSFHRTSSFSCSLDEDKRLIRWLQADARSGEIFYLSTNDQQGVLCLPFDVGNSNGYTIVLGKGPQLRMSDTEPKMIALSFLTEEQLRQCDENGFFAPWGNYLAPDIQSCRLKADFNARRPFLIQSGELVWDSARWNDCIKRRDPKGLGTLTPLRNEGDLVGKYIVSEWTTFKDMTLPLAWRFERLSVGGTNAYLMEFAQFAITNIFTTNSALQKPFAPGPWAVYDFRAASKLFPELVLRYINKRTNELWLDEDSKEFKSLVARTAPILARVLSDNWLTGVPRRNTSRTIFTYALLLALGVPLIFILVQKRYLSSDVQNANTTK